MMPSKTIVTLFAVVAVSVWLAGCGVSRMVHVESKPPGASIFVDGVNVGVTPKKVKLEYTRDPTARKILQINHRYYKPGFQTWTVEEVPQNWNIELKAE